MKEDFERIRAVPMPKREYGYRSWPGDIIERTDGRLLMSYKNEGIAARTSADRGRTWSDEFMLVPNPSGQGAYCHPSFLRLPDGEPLTVYEDAEDVAPRIGGWLRRDDLVLVYPLREDGTGEYSTFVTLPATGPGAPFSPFVFLGLLGEAPCQPPTDSTAPSPSYGGLPHLIDTLDRSIAGSQSMLRL